MSAVSKIAASSASTLRARMVSAGLLFAGCGGWPQSPAMLLSRNEKCYTTRTTKKEPTTAGQAEKNNRKQRSSLTYQPNPPYKCAPRTRPETLAVTQSWTIWNLTTVKPCHTRTPARPPRTPKHTAEQSDDSHPRLPICAAVGASNGRRAQRYRVLTLGRGVMSSIVKDRMHRFHGRREKRISHKVL